MTTHLREWTATSPAHSIATDGAHRTGRPRDDEILNALALHWPGYPAFLRSTAAESLLLSAHPTFTPSPSSAAS
ncbi:hypothetical protein KJK32_44865 [Streptomyces sp. JCM17656]|nr:hypothetical protein KJK32_44865 [Streptomyces sp. JCM17656]